MASIFTPMTNKKPKPDPNVIALENETILLKAKLDAKDSSFYRQIKKAHKTINKQRILILILSLGIAVLAMICGFN